MIHKKTIEKFWSHVVKSDKEDECWSWAGRINEQGYGQGITLSMGDGIFRTMSASRTSYYLVNGEIPDGLCVCHSCNNKLCCNPKHFYLATRQQNTKDASRSGLLGKHKLNGVDVSKRAQPTPELPHA
jgi:hypothetical protein